jgi:hypothetical protein
MMLLFLTVSIKLISNTQDELDVGISIKPKQRQSNKSVMIKAQVKQNITVF